jgi:hypothetical protein
MGTQATDGAAKTGGLRRLALPAFVAAAGATAGWLLTMDSTRLRRAASQVPESARDLVGELRERASSVAERVTPDSNAQDAGSGDLRELEARRFDRRKRREQRRKHATT